MEWGESELSQSKFCLVQNAIYTYFERWDTAKQMGNLVFLGLVKKGYFPNQQLFYWKNAGGHEVDFALRKGGNIERLVQLSHGSCREEVEKREIEVLTEASDG